jgi:hypothetical protein
MTTGKERYEAQRRNEAGQPIDADGTRLINGCRVIYEEAGFSIISHPNTGFQVYGSGGRVGTYKTIEAAKRRITKESAA